MTRLASKPHSIDVVRFLPGGMAEYPDWLRLAVEEGRVSFTIGDKESYASIYGERITARVWPGDYICRNSAGTIFVLTEQEVAHGFTPE